MPVTLQEEHLGTLSSLASSITLPATYTINIWVKNANLDSSQAWANLYWQSGNKYLLDAHYGQIGAGNWTNNSTPDASRLSYAAADPLRVVDTWHLVTVVYDGSTMEYYANGVSMGTVDPTANATLATAIDTLNGPAPAFAAEVKDMRVYSGVATAGEILASYNAGDGDLSPGYLGDNLVCYFKAEDLSDEQGGADATLSGVSPSNDGKYGSGWDMSTDVDGVITVPEISLATNDSVGYTAAMWVYNINNGPTAGNATSLMTGDSGPGKTYMPFYLGYNFSGSKKLFGSACEGNNQYYQKAVDVNTGADFILDGSLSPYVNAWTHILFTALGDEIKYYINGVHVATATHTAFNGAFDITRVGNLDSGWFGKHTIGDRIDEFAIWDRVLSQSEIDSVYDNEISTALLDDSLIAKYEFDSDLTDDVGSYDLTAFSGADVSDGKLILPNINSGVYPSSKISIGDQFTLSLWFEGLKDRNLAQANWMQFDGNSTGSPAGPVGSTGNHYIAAVWHDDMLGAYSGTTWASSGYSMTNVSHSGRHHLVAAYDNGTLTYYIDGVQAGSPVAYSNSGEIQVFGAWQGFNYAPAESLDEIRVYNRTLSSTEEAELYNNGANP